jgi:hypothetical protein
LDIPIRLDWTLTANSGELVPKATTVKPTISGDIPNKCAIREAPLTKNVAPAINPIKATLNFKNIKKSNCETFIENDELIKHIICFISSNYSISFQRIIYLQGSVGKKLLQLPEIKNHR